MTTFRYPRPEQEPTSPWSGFSDEARTALSRTAMGPSPADQLLTPDGGAEGVSAEVMSWANVELNNNFADGVLGSWKRYEAQLGTTIPRSTEELMQINPNLATTLTRLYEAKQALTNSGYTTPEGENVGETMHLALVPWQAIRNNLGDFSGWVNRMRSIQGIQEQDYINNDLLGIITQNSPLYRDLATGDKFMPAAFYLDKKIDQDGSLGVILVQTSNQAGLSHLLEGPAEDRSPDAMTNNGLSHFEIAGQAVDGLGIFEWLSLTFQSDPSQLSSQDYSWMLANRVDIDGDPHVPRGDWDDGRVGSYVDWAGDRYGNMRVRLAVM